jgi:hypothetical protein
LNVGVGCYSGVVYRLGLDVEKLPL